jgi:hypothetical protein
MRILGKAEKTFSELERGDKVYYIDPKKPTEIQFLPVKGVENFIPKKGYVEVEYYQSSEVLEIIKPEEEYIVPTKKILCKGSDTRILSMSMPPTVYFTNENALKQFMGLNLKH